MTSIDTTSSLQSASLDEVGPLASVCYFLGAGFSKACWDRYPVSKGFLVRKLTWMDLHGEVVETEYAKSMPALAGLLDHVEADHGSLDSLNIEHVLTDMHIRAYGLGTAWEVAEPEAGRPEYLGSVRRNYMALVTYIRHRLRLLDGRPSELPLARRLIDSLKLQDSIVTLNYDTIVERHLYADPTLRSRYLEHLRSTIGPPPVLYGGSWQTFDRYTDRKQGVFTKLHGSQDWSSCSNSICPHRTYMSPGYSYSQSSIRYSELRCTVCGSGAETVIVPPIASKAFERYPKLRLMWLQSHLALRRAQRWVFIGVSFAPTDFQLAALIRSASSEGTYFNKHGAEGQICVVSEGRDSAGNSAKRLLQSLSPTVRDKYQRGEREIALFPSVDEYFDVSFAADGMREDRVLQSGEY